MSNPKYTHFYGSNPVVFVPAGIDLSEYKEVSSVGDQYAKFIHLETGKILDCAEVHARFVEELEKPE